MSKEYDARKYPNLAEIVNPESRSLRVYYPGSGGDLLTPVLATNSDRFTYVDSCKLTEGYGHPDWTHLGRLEKEARILSVELDIQNNGETALIRFSYMHKQDKTPRQRSMTYYTKDAFIFWPPEFDEGYNVLITRGEAPSFNTHDIQMRQLGEKLVVGGFYISDRKISQYLLPEWVGFREIPNGVIFPCGEVKLYRKDRQESLELLSLLFQFEDRFWDLSFVKGGHRHGLYDLEDKSLQKVRAASYIFRQLPLDIQGSLRQRLPELQPRNYELFKEYEND